MQRRDVGGWILMGVLFIAAMSLIFYILLMRAQHLARMEEQRTQSPGGYVERNFSAHQPVVVLQPSDPGDEPVYAYLEYADCA